MEQYLVLVLIAISSGGAYLAGTKWLGLSKKDLSSALGKMLESVGLTILFGLVNAALWFVVVLAIRPFSEQFMKLYSDVTFLVFSLLQALIFQWWQQISAVRRR